MDLDWLQDIICLEKLRSFTHAARERNITQSAFSRRIRSLEAWLHTPLIDRTSYPIRLTAAGEAFLPVALQMVVQLQQVRQDLRESVAEDDRVVRIAAPHSIASTYLATQLAALHRAAPGVRTRVFSDNAMVCHDIFSQGYCDILLAHRHAAVPMSLDPELFAVREIGIERMVPVSEPERTLSEGWSLPGRPEAPTPLLAYDRDSFLGRVVANMLGSRAGPLHVQTHHVDAFAEAIRAMCCRGAGIAWLPERLIGDDVAAGRLVLLGAPDWQVEMQMLLYTAGEDADDPVRHLSDLLADAEL